MYYDNSKIGTNIKNLRKAYGETQKELGNVIGVENHTISQYESGKNLHGRETLQMIATHYGVSLERLLTDDFSNMDMTDLKLSWNKTISMFEIMYPIISTDEAMEDIYFQKAFHDHIDFQEKIKRGLDIVSIRQIERILKKYLLSYQKSGQIEAAANIANLMVLSYINYSYEEAEKVGTAIYFGKGEQNDFAKKYLLKHKIKIEDDKLQKKQTKKVYEKIIHWIKVLKKSSEYSDLGDYYIALLFMRNMVDNEKSAVLNEEFGTDMMLILGDLDNQYAVSYLEKIAEI